MIIITTENSVYAISSTSDGVGYIIMKTSHNKPGMFAIGQRFLANRWYIDREGCAHFDSVVTSKVLLVEDSQTRARLPGGIDY